MGESASAAVGLAGGKCLVAARGLCPASGRWGPAVAGTADPG